MAHKKARKLLPKKPLPTSAADAGCSSSISTGMAEMPALLVAAAANANNLSPPPPQLPHGVYFSPSPEESVGLLNRWIAGGKNKIPGDARGFVFEADIYGDSPDALRRLHSTASGRAGQQHAVPTWWFLGETKFQSPGAARKRADRTVQTGGYWRLEQSKRKLADDEDGGGVKNCFGFYLGGSSREHKTSWLMQEFTSDKDNGDGKKGVPALHKVYATPRPHGDKLRRICREDGVKEGAGGEKKPVPAGCFDAVVALLAQDQQEQGHCIMGAAPPPPAPAPAAGLPDDDNLSMPMDLLMAMLEEPAGRDG